MPILAETGGTPYADVSDVGIELGRSASSPEEEAQWLAWIVRVERAIQRAFQRAGLDLAEQVALDDPPASVVRDVEVAAVVRKVQNPSSLTSTTRSVDDGTITHRREGSADTDPLALTDAELRLLLPSVSVGAFSTRPDFEGGASAEPDWWGYEVGNHTGPWIG